MFSKSFIKNSSKLIALLTISALAINNPMFLNSASALTNKNQESEGGGGREEPKPTPAPKPSSSQPKNYPAAVKYLLANSSSIQQIATTAWDLGGKAIAEEEIKKELGNQKIREGVSTYNANVGLSGIRETQVSPGASTNQVNVKIIIPGNNSEFKTTTPTIFGGYADPSFRVMFDLEVNLKLSALTNQIKIDDVSVKIDKAKVNGSNAVGTLVETLGDLFTNGRFSQGIVANINSDKSKKDYLASSIRSSLDRYVPASVITAPSVRRLIDSIKIMEIDTSVFK